MTIKDANNLALKAILEHTCSSTWNQVKYLKWTTSEVEEVISKSLINNNDSKQMTLDKLHDMIIEWGADRNFYNPKHGTTTDKQFLKLSEEVGEMAGNLARGKCIKDDLGDTLVVLIGLAKLSNTNILDCLELAYNDIKDRKGKMIDGVFVKESDLF